MTGLPDGMQAHLDGEVTTLCHAWRLLLADGGVLGFTDHDQMLVIDSAQFEPQSGFTATEARETLGLSVDAMEVAGALSSEMIRAEDIASGRFDKAVVETLLVNWQDTAQAFVIRRASLGRITTSDGGFSAELESAAHALDQPQGRIFRRSCDAELGDARCGKAIGAAPFTRTGVVLSVNAADWVRVSGLDDRPSGWFEGGTLTFANAAAPLRILSHIAASGGARLRLNSVAGISADMPVVVTAGCDKAFSTCRAKFANAAQFRGFPHLPGNEAAYSYVTEDAVLDGGPLVP